MLEAIRTYRVNLTVEPDGDFLVTKAIRLRSESDLIRRGIFRDILELVETGGITSEWVPS
ncbi:hypothetical protein F8A10_15060 [Paracoccus kondratievae]|nr:hypothetical protein F8A10_15060 [Paracoccus kondratievae]